MVKVVVVVVVVIHRPNERNQMLNGLVYVKEGNDKSTYARFKVFDQKNRCKGYECENVKECLFYSIHT